MSLAKNNESADLAISIDVMHGLYARVLSDPQEWPSFCDTYFSCYTSKAEWTRRICEAAVSEDRRMRRATSAVAEQR
jgi:hypothetical protein